MVLVILAAILQASLFLLFRIFEKRRIALMPAIAVNYLVATAFGVVMAPPWLVGGLEQLWLPSAGIGVLFMIVFFLTGITSQRAGVAASTVASKMSVVLTVLFAVLVHQERPGMLGWTGLIFATAGVVLASWTSGPRGARSQWLLPTVLFIGTACVDISINAVQRGMLSLRTEAVFPTLCTAFAGSLAFAILIARRSTDALRAPAVWIGGALLGVLNYATLYFVVKALAHGGAQASTVFPLISVGVILLGTVGSFVLFSERISRSQFAGIGLAVIALALLIAARK
jgi:drug/metabolite transporter (DMT)-like permease